MGSISVIPVALSGPSALSVATIAGLNFQGTVENIVATYGEHVDSEGRGPVERFRADTLDDIATELETTTDKRADAFGDASGWFQPRELEYRYQRTLEERKPRENALLLFPVDSEVPLGARTHTVSRFFEQADAVWYRGGVEVPLAQVSEDQETFHVRYLVSGYEESVFDRQSAAFANKPIAARKQGAAILAIERKINKAAWYGDKEAKLWGIFDYPYLATTVSAVNYSIAGADDVLADMHAARNYPEETSLDVFAPNAVVTSRRVFNRVMQKPRTTNSDMTVGQMWLRDNGTITSIQVAQECQAVGPAGEDAMFFYRREVDTVAICMVQGPTVMPTQQQGFMFRTYIWAAYGGVIMRDVGNCLLHWVTL